MHKPASTQFLWLIYSTYLICALPNNRNSICNNQSDFRRCPTNKSYTGNAWMELTSQSHSVCLRLPMKMMHYAWKWRFGLKQKKCNHDSTLDNVEHIPLNAHTALLCFVLFKLYCGSWWNFLSIYFRVPSLRLGQSHEIGPAPVKKPWKIWVKSVGIWPWQNTTEHELWAWFLGCM